MQKQDLPFTLHCYNASRTTHKVYALDAGGVRHMLRVIRAGNKHSRPSACVLWRVVRNSDGRELTGLRDN